MLLSSARQAKQPETLPLSQSPLVPVPLHSPPKIAWIGVGTHGHLAREDYRLPTLWCLHLYRWTGGLTVEDVSLPVRPGHASLILPDRALSHYFRTSDPPAIHLSAGFTLTETTDESSIVYVPMMQDLTGDFGTLNRQMEEAIGSWPIHPRRAEARLWEILWTLAERVPGIGSDNSASAEHPAVARAREIIELRLGEPLRITQIASAVDLSHNHLTRLFRAATGKSVIAYIKERRMERACRLLQHTTLPIKSIAAQVGLPDLHQFNKAIREATGNSPRQVRKCDAFNSF